MKLSLLLLLLIRFDDCGPPPQVEPRHGHNIGIVRSIDWTDRSFIMEEDGTHIQFQLKGCGENGYGAVPVWVGQHIEISYTQPSDGFGYVLRQCQIFDMVRRLP